ncbi:EamA family transporter RarD [Fodinicurvata sp. EGI_FJ10296]|uniref:EamA family transporter RarD n=1 Tax=Fodinicurvata sp. EGI_FJ10296 TaxID=3231908 RepID=UPI00345503BC
MTDRPLAVDRSQLGLVQAFGAFLLWGVLPLYFRALDNSPIFEIMAHRITWTVLLLIPLVIVLRRSSTVVTAFQSRRLVGVFAVTTVLVSLNWLIYMYAISIERLLDASLGYYINPLINVALGVIFLGETLNRRQMLAVGLAAAGVLNQTITLGAFPWIALGLALTFGFYGLIRKRERIDPIGGLLVETSIILPIAVFGVFWFAVTGTGRFAVGGLWESTLLVGTGVVTATPLILFMMGAQKLRYSTIGLMQYLAPTIQFLIAVLIFKEPFGVANIATFLLIWSGLAIYTWDALTRR